MGIEDISIENSTNVTRIIANLNIGQQLIIYMGEAHDHDPPGMAIHMQGPVRQRPEEFQPRPCDTVEDEFLQIMTMIDVTLESGIGYEYIMSIMVVPPHIPDNPLSNPTFIIPCHAHGNDVHFHVIPIDEITRKPSRESFMAAMEDHDTDDLSLVLKDKLFGIYEDFLVANSPHRDNES